jgi:hypothetical protein
MLTEGTVECLGVTTPEQVRNMVNYRELRINGVPIWETVELQLHVSHEPAPNHFEHVKVG